MTQPRFAYWKADENSKTRYISGWCEREDIDADCLVGEIPLPTDIEKTEEGIGNRVVTVYTSPAVFGGRYAYRFQARLMENDTQILQDGDYSRITGLIRAYRIEAPQKDTTRENWFWYIQDQAWRPCEPPVRLLKKWQGPLLDILTQSHENRAEILARWQERIDAHDAHNRRKRERTENPNRYGRKRAGDIVVTRRAHHFRNAGSQQIFRLKPFGRRDQLGMFNNMGHMRYRISVGPAQIACAAWLEDIDAPGPVGLSALLARAHDEFLEMREGHHARIDFCRKWKADILTWFDKAMHLVETIDTYPVFLTFTPADSRKIDGIFGADMPRAGERLGIFSTGNALQEKINLTEICLTSISSWLPRSPASQVIDRDFLHILGIDADRIIEARKRLTDHMRRLDCLRNTDRDI